MYEIDITFWLYSLTAFGGAYGAVLFSWWWYKKGSASSMYAYITFLYYGFFYCHIINVWARYLRFATPEKYIEFMSGPLWISKTIPILIIIITINTHITFKIFNPVIEPMDRRKKDNE